MTVALQVGLRYYTVGSSGFFNAFFSTVFIRLENSNWGSLYSVIMNRLYQGVIEEIYLKQALLEMQSIRLALTAFPPSQVIWDFEDLSARPPWGDVTHLDIKNLSDYFITADGSNLIDMMIRVFEQAISVNKTVEIDTI